MLTPTFTVCALFFGDYPDLAKRCLDPIVAGRPAGTDLRIGTNAIGDATRSYLNGVVLNNPLTRWYDAPTNIYKYPLMRQMVLDPVQPILSEFVVWFDDDSCILPAYQATWWSRLAEATTDDVDMLGLPYQITWNGEQRQWVRQQLWYNGKDPARRNSIRFFTGGWWCCRTELLRKFNYPWPELKHNGGDTMLGELAFQQNWRRKTFATGLAINAGPSLQHSTASRRGFSERPIGARI